MSIRTDRWWLPVLLAGLWALSCGPREETGPGQVRWDRDICERCRMAVSDHYYSAQVRGGPAESRTRLYFFDDIGCAVLWLAEQEWKADPRTGIWVTDYRNGAWLDATACRYELGKITPMDFNLGALPTHEVPPGTPSIDYAAAVEHIGRRMAEKKQQRDDCCEEEPEFLKKDTP
jgi:copper chaperone NosL